MDGVSGVMPAYSTDALVNTEEEDSSVARIHGLPVGDLNDDNPDYLNRVTVTEGRLPEKPGECVLEEDVVGSRPVELGSTIRISPENKDDLSDTLADTEFTVVGYVKSAYYFSIERDQTTVGDGTIDLILYIDEKSFCMEAYSDIFLTVAQAKDENTFSKPRPNWTTLSRNTIKTKRKPNRSCKTPNRNWRMGAPRSNSRSRNCRMVLSN